MRILNPDMFDARPPDGARSVDAWSDYAIDLAREYPPIDYLLKYEGVGCIPAADIQVITGKMKAGKTFAALSLEVALLCGDFMGFTGVKDDIRVLHIDTEQAAANVVKKARLVHTLCGWPESIGNDRFKVLSLRECSYEDRLRITIEAIEGFRPHFVLVDGVRDMLADFNSIDESAALVNELMRVSSQYQCAVMGVLHENKTDGNARGHLGSEILNKCSESYTVSKKDDTVTVEQVICRNAPIDKWAFRIDKDGVPIPDIPDTRSKKQLKRDAILTSIFACKKSYSHSELTAEYMERSANGERTARYHIADALDDGVIGKSDKGNYYFSDFGDDEEIDIFK